ncbi:hypothetical protein H6F88_00635 [Oculatella sp. FACHB-28]|uniref:hypothetical protein n=1 Tax=Oculatella sp. FACHB-28 TaxID=2692845 RepID=UPI001682DEFC|nr:hypothetical protein [Oculatella sp. FACHB-28]MBD2054551.1 hypothetical protein [Oculatella sp. FACHB-28]
MSLLTLPLTGFCDTTVDWGRYAELFEYDAGEDRLYLPEPVEVGGSAAESMG